MTIEMRPLSRDDATTIHRIVRAAEVAEGWTFQTPLAELEEVLDAPHVDPCADGRLALLDGEPVGYALVDHTPAGERLERAFLQGSVRPDRRRRGVGTALFSWQLDRARQVLAAYTHDAPRYARTQARDVQSDALALYERHGLRAVRYTDELIRPLGAPLEVPEVEGVEVVPWDPARSEEVRAVRNAAFADHWGTTVMGEVPWRHWLAESSKRLDLSWIAVVDGAVVGYTLNDHFEGDEAVSGRRDGWLSHIGVLREVRGRGVASTLIAASIASFRDAGFTHAMLGVDTENPSGAYGLYRRLGFEPYERWVTHEIEVQPSTG
ncbi:GNAT family N-acetyltransferase [Actinomarinicola tropica]|uniref:GNAT family N-acetyltransferase n=1 Tax=Actinomarinicola tropica TaxID=2789776 RepID=A0A5Q2RDU5_9ACTN|nr:GNAT family N-acetyltransferase [Actinomarinicola tropica]QGG93854.1 GNAT family N-acetyltransferase [Actinomarinicola tropica]